jgi:thiol-disulfide isomerase/thioredoxin
LLAQEVVREHPSRVRFVVEDFGASPRAERFGIDKYPAVFVDDALVARPEDFYEWGTKTAGKYVPWRELTNKRSFQNDLRKLVLLRLAGEEIASLQPAQKKKEVVLPSTIVTDLEGKRFDLTRSEGKPRLIEVWATWCPPCIESLPWLDQLPATDVSVVTVVVESKQEDIDKITSRLKLRAPVVVADHALRELLGGPPAVPTLILTDGKGRVVKTFYGAPPDLHQQVESALRHD